MAATGVASVTAPALSNVRRAGEIGSSIVTLPYVCMSTLRSRPVRTFHYSPAFRASNSQDQFDGFRQRMPAAYFRKSAAVVDWGDTKYGHLRQGVGLRAE